MPDSPSDLYYYWFGQISREILKHREVFLQEDVALMVSYALHLELCCCEKYVAGLSWDADGNMFFRGTRLLLFESQRGMEWALCPVHDASYFETGQSAWDRRREFLDKNIIKGGRQHDTERTGIAQDDEA